MIAREGIPFILILASVTVLLFFAAYFLNSTMLIICTALFAVLTVFVTFFFRDPDRIAESTAANVIISPADGRVIGVDTLGSYPGLTGPVVKVSIFLSVFDVHVNRVPVSGTVSFFRYVPGSFKAAFADKASDENEHTEIGIRTDAGITVIVKQIAGLIARRIVCRIKDGDRVNMGERFGMIRFGSRTEFVIDADKATIDVKRGDYVVGGKTVIGYLSPNDRTQQKADGRETNAKL